MLRSKRSRPSWLRLAAIAATAAVALACADSVSPDRSPDVLAHVGSAKDTVHDTTHATPSDTSHHTGTDTTHVTPSDSSYPAGQIAGTVIDVPSDSTASWHAVAGVSVELGQRDPRTGTVATLATTTSDTAGRFVFPKLPASVGLLYVRAVPGAGTPYRATRWIAGYSMLYPSITLSGPVSAALGPYLALERASAPQRGYAPVLLAGHVRGDEGRTAVPNATVLIAHLTPVGGADSLAHLPPTPDAVVASARTDANGFFLVALPAPGLYAASATVPAGSPFLSSPLGGAFVVSANAESSILGYVQLRLARR
jgi:hypothetical protein